MPITPRTLAAGIIGATHELGDHEGHYIGTTGKERKPVFLEMGLASLLDESPAATFYGRLGVGKSFNANLLLYLNLIFGGYGIIFDPKGERSHWEKDLSTLKGFITTVTIGTSAEDEGMLDAYKIYNNMIGLKIRKVFGAVSKPQLQDEWWGPGDARNVDTSIRPFKIEISQKV